MTGEDVTLASEILLYVHPSNKLRTNGMDTSRQVGD